MAAATSRPSRPRLSRASTTKLMSRSTCSEAGVQLWHAHGLREEYHGFVKDAELWDASGDCLVYLYARGASKRPASFRISRGPLEQAGLSGMLSALHDVSADGQSPNRDSVQVLQELHLGSPKHLNRDETFLWHLATRNFFAWLLQKPLAAAQLSLALQALLDRMNLFRPDNTENLQDLLVYADKMSYSQLAGEPELATAMLVFTEEQKLKDRWIDAFTHCVGMSGFLIAAPDYILLDEAIKVLITKASVEMSIKLQARRHAVDNFLEDDFENHLGLGLFERQHLDHFRSFLQTYFVSTHGYWPPPPSSPFPKKSYASLAADFQTLYDLLADVHSPPSAPGQTSPNGVNVLQSVNSFDQRHGLQSLEIAQPLLPETLAGSGRQGYRSIRRLISGLGSKVAFHHKTHAAFHLASNSQSPYLSHSPLVQAFLQFEAASTGTTNDRAAAMDARKVRWLLIYGMLQMLKDMLRAPAEVTGQDRASYSLACDTTNLPMWSRAMTTRDSGVSIPGMDSQPCGLRRSSLQKDDDFVRIDRNSVVDRETEHHTAHGSRSTLRPRTLSRSMSTKSTRLLSRARARWSTASLVVPLPVHGTWGSSSTWDFSQFGRSIVPGRESPSSEVPSLDWSRGSTDMSSTSDRTSEEELGRVSTSSSVYSSRPVLPQKSLYRSDQLDKGLAMDDLILPGLC